MWSFNLVRWLKSRFRSRVKTIERKPRFRLCIEELETRLAPAQFVWTGAGADADWSTIANWQGGAAPTSTPANLADLIFDSRGAARLTTNNNISGLLVNSIQIANLSNYNITDAGGGHQLTLGDTSAPSSGSILVAAGLTGETLAVDIKLAATSASQQFFTVGSAGVLTLSGQLSGISGSQLTKRGTGTLILTNDNSGYVGPFNIENDAGIVRITNSKALGAATNTVTVGNNSQLQLDNVGAANPIANSLKLFGTGFSSDGSLYARNLTAGSANVWSGSVAMGSNTSFNVDTGATLQITGGVSDLGVPFNVTKIGQGELIFANANTYRGSTTVADGTLTISHPLALGSVPAAGTSVVRNTLLGTIGTLKLQFDATVAPTTTVPSTYWTLQNPAQAFDAINNPYIGFVVNNVPLTLNAGGFGNNGALWNFRGNNTWTGVVTLGSAAPVGANVVVNVDVDAAAAQTRLFVTGVIQDLATIPATGPFTLTKIGGGDLVLAPTNQGTGLGTPNLYRGDTFINFGTVTLRDSQGLGPQTKRHITTWTPIAYNQAAIATVAAGASLNLESNVGHIDSITGTVNRLQVASPLSITGTGYNAGGALHSISGINTYTVKYVTSPTQNAITGAAGGSLAIGTTFYYVVTALDGYGESLASNEQSFPATAGARTANLSWNQVVGATGYKIYRSTTSGTYGASSLVTTINLGSTTTYPDTGTALVAGTPPTVVPIIQFAAAGTGASIGVEPDPNQTASVDYFTNDYSLTINGGLSGTTAQKLTKVGTGHLILPNPNNQFFGNTDITLGWITIEDPNALGGPNLSVQEVQPLVDVAYGAALMLKPFATGTSFSFTHNLSLQGLGIQHPFAKINNMGAVENLSGFNTLNSNVLLKGAVGIGVEEVFGRSDLVMTGSMSEGLAALNFTGNPSGGAQQNIGPAAGQNPVDTGSTSGLLTISAKVHSIADDIRVYLGNWKVDPANAVLIYDASNDFVSAAPTAVNQWGADITIAYTPTSATITVVDTADAGPGPPGVGTGWLYEGLGPQGIVYPAVNGLYPTWVTIVVNPGKVAGGFTQWTYTAAIVPGGNFGGLAKLGSQRLDIQGPGTYHGGVDIRDGVVRVENNTALGAPNNSGTTVQAGAALELANPVADANGGQTIGAAIWGTPLTLNGTGNSTFGDAPLAVLAKDNYWHGPITLNSQVTLTFQGSLANTPINALTSNNGGVTVTTTTPGGSGLDAVQTISFAGMTNGTTFTLTYDDGVNPPATTSNITFNTDPFTLIYGASGIVARLNSVLGAGRFGVSLASPIINIYPNARLLVTGAIGDAQNATANGTDLIMDGGGSLLLAGSNSYRGTTFVNQGILTLQSSQALGAGGIDGQDELILTGARAGTTQFTVSFDGGPASTVITYNGNASDATNIDSALSNAFFTASGHTGGTATVIQTNPGVFLITFGGTLAGTTLKLSAKVTSGPGVAAVSAQGGTNVADKAQLQLEGGITISGEPLTIQGAGNNVESALQTFTVGSTTLVPTGTFSLNFNAAAVDTGPLANNSTAGQIQAALQNLTTVKNTGGKVLVSVDKVVAGTNEEQRITFNGFVAGDTYQVYYDPAAGAPQLGYNITAPLTYTGNPFTEKNNIVAALGNLQTIGGLSVGGTISGIASAGVSAGVEYADFLFTGALADQDVISVQANVVTGAGTPTVSEFVKGATGYRSYTVGFQGSFDGKPQPDLTAGATGVTGSTTLSTPVTTLVGGSLNATPIQWIAQGPAPITNAVVNGGVQPAGNQLTAGRVTGVDVQLGNHNDGTPLTEDIYIATSDGGFWRTVDGGKHWTPVFDNIGGAVIFGGTVTIARTANSTVYFGTGEGNNSADSFYGAGVYSASTHADLATKITTLLTNPDGSNPLAGKAINKIAVNPNNPTMIWVAASDRATNGSTGNAGIWRYDGTVWLDMTPPGAPGSNFAYSDVAIENNGATLRLYAALGNPTGNASNDVRISDNPSAAFPSWNASTNFVATTGVAATSIGTIKLATVSGVFGRAYAVVSNTGGNSLDVLVTANGGTTWAKTGNNPTNYLAGRGNYDIALAVKRVGANDLIFVGGHDTGTGTNFVIRSVNSGGAWGNISKDVNNVGPHTDIHSLVIDQSNNLVAGTDGGVWRWDNTASTWADLNGDLAITQLNAVAVQPGTPSNILGGTQNNGLAQATATQIWTQVDPAVAVGSVTALRFVPGSVLTAYAIAGGNIHQSLDGGANWNNLGAAADDFDVDLVSASRLLYALTGFTIRESANSGASFIPLNSPNASRVAGATYQGTFIADPYFSGVNDIGANSYVPDTIYAASTTNLFVTKDHGLTWTGTTVPTSVRTPPLLVGTTIQDIVVDPSNSDVVYVITAGRITTAGTGRVFKTTDAGLTWTDLSAGLNLSAQTGSVYPAWRLVIDYRTNDLYLGTDEGVWKLTGAAGDWQRFGAGLPVVQVRDLDLNASANILTAATFGRGAWQFFLDDNTVAYAPIAPGAFRSIAGNNVWTGPITLAGPTTISANGSQALQNGLSTSTLTIFGSIGDLTATTANTLTKVGGGDVILSGASTYAGVTDIQQGNVVVRNPSALGGAAVAGMQALSLFTTAAPTQKAPALVAGVSTLANSTLYYYEITAVGPQGESIASNEQSILTSATATTQQIQLSWNGVAGATGYNIYRSTSPAPYGPTSLLATIASAATVTYTDTGAALSVGAPPVLTFTLKLGGATTPAISYTGVPATDAAAIAAQLTGAFFTAAGYPGVTATVSATGAGLFLISFTGAPLASANQPMFTGALVTGFGSASVTNGGGTIVEKAAALELESSLFAEPVTLNGDGIQPSYSGHNTGALRSLSNTNTYTGNLTLNTNATIGVDTGSTLTISAAAPITLTSTAHGLTTGNRVTVSGVVGDTAANGAWTITVVDANHFSLNGSAGNAGYVSGGVWTLVGNISAASAATGALDIRVTSVAHGLSTGNLVTISGVLGNTAANGTFTITKIDNDNFSLNGTAGGPSLAYNSGGLWLLAHGITGATNANPIRITSNNHGLVTSNQVIVSNVLGNIAANGPWTITKITNNTFDLQTADGTASGPYTANTGTWTRPAATGAITGASNPIGITDNGLGYSLVKESPGTLIFASPDTYGSASAGTTVNQGILNIQNSNALGVAGSTTTVRDGAQLQLQSAAGGTPVVVANENLTLSGTGIAGAGALLNVSGNNTWGSAAVTVTLTSVPGFSPVTTPAGAVSFGVAGANDNLTIASPIVEPTVITDTPTTGPLPMGLTKVGPGRLVLTQSNTYSGSTYVNEGIVRIQNAGALGVDSGNDTQRLTTFDALGTNQFTLSFNGQVTGLLAFGIPDTGGATPTSSVQAALASLPAVNGVANVNVTRQTISLVTLSGTQIGYAYTITFVGALAGKAQPLIVAVPTGGMRASASRVADGGASTLVADGASLELDGDPLGVAASIAVPASELLTLNGTGSNRTYAITVAAEVGTTVTLTTASTAGLFTGETVAITGFTPNGYNGVVAITVIDATRFSYTAPSGLGAVTVLGSAAPMPGALHNVTGNNTWAGKVTLLTSSTMGVDPGTQLSVTGTVQDPTPNPTPSPIPPADLTKVGAGTLVFPTANTYTGNTFVDTGILNIRNNTALGVNTSSVQTVSVSGTSGTFKLAFGVDSTGDLPFGTPASGGSGPLASVQNALNALSSISTGGGSVIVTQLGNTYTVFFNGGPLASSAQPLLTGSGTAGTTVTIAPIQLGAESDTVVASGAALQLQGGITESSLKPLFLNSAGPAGAGALENVAGNNSVSAAIPVILQTNTTIGVDGASDVLTLPGTVTDQHQVQTINLGAFPNNTQYTLTFNGQVSSILTYNNANTAAARTANAAAIQAALNAMASITLAGGVVSVPAPGAGTTYSISFGGRMIGTSWPAIVVTRISTGGTFNAGTSMASTGTGSTLDKVGPGTLQYAGVPANTYTGLTHVIDGTLQLNKNAGTNAIVGDLTIGSTSSAEVQTVTITGAAGTFGLTFNGQTTGNLAFNVPASGGAGPTASMQNALTALSTIGGVGGTAVVTKLGNVYTVTFGGTLLGADLPALVLTGTVNPIPATVVNGGGGSNEIQSLTVTGTSGTFTLTSGPDTTVALPYNIPATGGALPGDSLQNALNALPTINGAVAVSKLGNVFTIVYSGTLANTDVPLLVTAVTPVGTIATLADGALFAPAGTQIVMLLQSNQIANTSNVLVNGDGWLDLNHNNEGLGTTLTVIDGRVTTGAGTLTLLNASALNMTGGTITEIPLGIVDLRGGVTATSTFTAPATITGAGTVDLHGATRTFTVNDGPTGSDLVVNSVIADLTGSNGLTKAGAGRLELGGVNTYAGVTRINTGDVQVDTAASINNVSLAGGSLSGKGNVGAVTMFGGSTGTVDPGYNGTASPYGVLNSLNVNWNSNSTFFVDLKNASAPSAPAVGSDYDQLNVTGNAILGLGAGSGARNVLLDGSPGAGIQVGDQFTILQTTGSVTGLFDGIIAGVRNPIPDGGAVFLNGQKFTVNYFSDHVVLTRQYAIFTSFDITVDHNASVYGQEVTYTVTAVPEPGASLATAAPLVTFGLDSGLYTHPVYLDASGIATYSPQTQHGLVWAPGINHTITAPFTDANNVFQPATPTGSPITQVVNKNTVNIVPTSTPVVSGTVPVYGQDISIIATVTPVVAPDVPGASNPTNNVQFTIDALAPQYIPINPYAAPPSSETATLNISGSTLLGFGPHAVAIAYAGTPAAYTGDTNYAASAAATMFNYDVKADQTLISFLPAPQPSYLGQIATFNLQVTRVGGSFGQPVGVLDLFDGVINGTPLNATPIAYSAGTISFSTTTLTVGFHNIIARFTPTGNNYLASTQTYSSFLVNPATTSTTILTNYTPAAPTYGQAVNFNLQVIPTPPIAAGFGLPTNTITLWDQPTNGSRLVGGASSPGNIVINTVGHGLVTGQNVVVTGVTGNTAANGVFSVVRIDNDNFSLVGSVANGSYAGGGTWNVAVNLGTGAVNSSNGLATVTTTAFALAQGNHTLAAVYNGDGQFGQSTGYLALFVAGASANTSVGAVPNPGDYNNPITLTATVTSTVPSPPTGPGAYAIFWDGAVGAATGTTSTFVIPAVGNNVTINVGANAAFSPAQTVYITDGTHTITATINSLIGGTQLSIKTASILAGSAGQTMANKSAVASTTLGAAVMAANGTGTLILASGAIAAGNHTIRASYLDLVDTNYTNGTNTPLSLPVNNAPTTTVVNAPTWAGSPTPPVFGQPITFNATVTSPSGSVTIGVGSTVTFWDGPVGTGTIIGTGAVTNAAGQASFTTTAANLLSATSHTINAAYADTADQFFKPSNTTLAGSYPGFGISKADTTVNPFISSSTSTGPAAYVSSLGQSVTFTATVVSNSPSIAPVNSTVAPGSTVTFFDNAVPIGSAAAINGSGVAFVTTSAMIIGNHTITARYNGSGNFNVSPDASLTQVVKKASSINVSALSVGNNYGLDLTYNGTVVGTGGGTPTGTVSVFEGATLLATSPSITASATPGTANFTVTIPLATNLSVGSHSLTFVYSGDSSPAPGFAPAASIVNQTINKAVTTTAIDSDSPIASGFRQAYYGQTVTFTAIVTAQSAGTPPNAGAGSYANGSTPAAGGVIFRDNGVTIVGAVTLTGTTATTATYTIATSALALGTHSISASYVAPSASNHASSAGAMTQKIVQASTSTTLTSSSPVVGSNPQSNYGQTITFTAVVTSVSGGTPAFGPTVYDNRTTSGVPLNFYIANSSQWNGFLPVAGTVTRTTTTANSATYVITTALLPASTQNYQVQAYYLGNANFAATPIPQITNQPAAVVFQKVVPAVTTTAMVSASPAPSAFGQSVTFTATATAQSGGNPPTTYGYMRFYIDSVLVGLGSLASTTPTTTTYTFTTSTLNVNTGPGHSIQAQYVTDNANFAWSTVSAPLMQIVNKAQTATALSSTPTQWASDAATTFVASVSYAAGNGGSLVSGGSVTFYDGASPLATVNAPTGIFAYNITYNYTTTLSTGPHTITATYSSTSPNIAGSSDIRSQTVARYSNLALSQSASTVPMGSTVAYTAILTALNNVPIANATINWTINGVNYTRTTDTNGRVTLSNLFSTSGTYTITATFPGDGTFNPATNSLTTVVTTGRLA